MPVVLIVFLASIALSALLVLLARLTHRHHRMRGSSDPETAYVTSVCALYGIFLAFMIFTAWSRYDEAQKSVRLEANDVAELYHTAASVDGPLGREIQSLSLRYARSIVNDEWVTMINGQASPRTEAIVREMWELCNRMRKEVADDVLHDHLLTSWTDLDDRRRMRLLWSYTGLSHYIYAVLFVGAFITVGMSSLFTVDDVRTHIIKAASLAAIIGLMLATVWALGHPFRGQLALPPDAFNEVLWMLGANHGLE